ADALGMAQGQRLAGDPEKLIARALEIDRDNLKALALAGTAAFERKDFKAAAAYWERMLPLAVLRKQVRDLPVAFSLDDSMAMAPGLKLSGFSRVLVGARISRSGSATPQPGDLQGISAPVANDATGVAVVIDTVR